MELTSRIDELIGEFGLAEAELAGDGWRVALRRAPKPAASPAAGMYSLIEPELENEPPIAPAGESPAPVTAEPKGTPVSSPMMGIYYTASSPNAPAFVKVGDSVEEGQVVGLIEAMKVFNEIVAPMAGTVTEMAAQNGQLVQPGEPLLYLAP
jgi:acetyl-CoA carboxylase biotin carboxyl carrier protein